ncbi:MAG: hypothetical protein AAFN78_10520 [Pseudomonadota bacterium]
MSNEIAVALVSAFASLAVALVALWQAIRVGRQQSVLAALQASADEAKPLLEYISAAWADLQRIKHAIDMLLVPGRPETRHALESLSEATDSLIVHFEHHGSKYPRHIREVWHDTKNYCTTLRAAVNTRLDAVEPDLQLPEETKSYLLGAREAVGRFQDNFQSDRDNFRISLFHELKKMVE